MSSDKARFAKSKFDENSVEESNSLALCFEAFLEAGMTLLHFCADIGISFSNTWLDMVNYAAIDVFLHGIDQIVLS